MDFLHHWGMSKLFSDLPHTLVAQLQEPVFLMQAGIIILLGLLSWWLGRVVRPSLRHSVAQMLPRRWAPPFIHSCEQVLWPLFWLAMLWPALLGAGLAETRVGLLDAFSELLAAWVCIRFVSLAVKSHAASITLSVLVWSIVALSIVGLLDPLVHQMEISAIHIGKFRLSALTVIHAAIALVVLLWLTAVLFRFLSRQIEQSQKLPPSLRVLLIQVLRIILPVLAVLIALSAAGVNLTGLTVISGAVFLGIGLGLQKVAGNLIAGFSLLMGKSLKPGDVINYKGSIGQITELDARHVGLRMLNGVEHIIPNAYFLENGVENLTYTDTRYSFSIPVGITYDADPREAMRLAVNAAKAVARVLADPPPTCLIKALGDSAIELEIGVSIADPEGGIGDVRSNVLLGVWDSFRAAGIGFACPQRDIRVISVPEGVRAK